MDSQLAQSNLQVKHLIPRDHDTGEVLDELALQLTACVEGAMEAIELKYLKSMVRAGWILAP